MWVLVELISKELDFVDDTVGMVSVSFTEEELSLVVQLMPLLVGLILEDVSLLFQTFTDVLVNRLEPVPQFWVAVGIGVDVLDAVEEIFAACAIGKAFDQSLDFCQRLLICFDES